MDEASGEYLKRAGWLVCKAITHAGTVKLSWMPAARRIVIAEMAKLRALGSAIEPLALLLLSTNRREAVAGEGAGYLAFDCS